MEVQVMSEDITPEEMTAEMGWRTARFRRPDEKCGQNSSREDPPQSQDSRSRSKTRKNVKSQVLKAGRMPQLPKNEIKIIVRPKGELTIPKVGSPTVTAAIFQATQLSPEETQDDTICPNVQQNVVISTPRPHNADRYVRMKSIHVNGVTHEANAYEATPDNTTKIRGIPLTDSAQEIDVNIINARNPLALAAKRIGSTTTIVITFADPVCRTWPDTVQHRSPAPGTELPSLKQPKTQPPPKAPEPPNVTPSEEPPTPAPKKRALQGGDTGQVRSGVNDMLVSLQSTVESLHSALLAVMQRVTAIENSLQTVVTTFTPVTPAIIMDSSGIAHDTPAPPSTAS
ncbi:hypothetical protein HPB49_024605 [Dermacentor silvarum]|uniref:Uncharacterized protein n=1 Tax=Dermacentor silvarum TaxID=543639 RepID=A0ACB8CNF5_DERSI|nr:hypothetical protein HPB49_024605 [Dermacentor silvarum]